MSGKCRRTLATLSACAVGMLVIASSASAQWITFNNESATRLANATGNTYAFLSDGDEKDYASGDVDRDGDTDFVVVRKQPLTTQGKRSNYLFLNENGVLVNRTVQLAPQLLDPTNDRDVELFDANGDGWLDMATAVTFPQTGDANSVKMPRLYMNLGADGNGNWLGFSYNYADQRIPDFPRDPFFCSVVYGDLDGDNDLDLFFTDYAADSSVPDPAGGPLFNRVLLNNGMGFFTDVTQTNMVNSGASAMLGNGFGTNGGMADLDGDGDLDLLSTDSCSATPRTVRLARNNGSAMFTGTRDLTACCNVYHFDFGDINNDGRIDFYTVDDNFDNVFQNNGNDLQGYPTFTVLTPTNQQTSPMSQATTLFGGNTYCVDLNNDGRLDQVTCDEDVDLGQAGNRMAIFRNTGASPWLTRDDAFLSMDGTLPTRDTYDVAILDINRDGKLDLVVGKKNVPANTGTQVFVQPDTTAPTIVSSTPANGTRDVFEDRDGGGNLEGITQLAITFDSAVRDAATDGNVTAASFSVTLTTNLVGLTPPAIASVAKSGNTYTLTFNRPITPGAWNTVTANVEDWSGNALVPNPIDLGFLPGDINGGLLTTGQDVLAEVTGINTCLTAGTCGTPGVIAQFDVNRNGTVSGQDVLRLVQLVNGQNTQNAWNGVALPPQP